LLYIITSLIAFCYARSLKEPVSNIDNYKKINEQHRLRNEIGKLGHRFLGEKLLGEHPGHPVYATPTRLPPRRLQELKEVHSFFPHFYEKELHHENSLYHEPQELNHGPVFIPHPSFHHDLEAKYTLYKDMKPISADGGSQKRSGKSTRRKKSRKRNNKKNKVKKPNKMKNKKLIRMQNNKLIRKLKEKKGKISKIENDKNKLADKKIMTDDMKLKDAKLMKKDIKMRDARTKDGMKMRDAKMMMKDNKMMTNDMKMKDAIVKDTIAKKDTKN